MVSPETILRFLKTLVKMGGNVESSVIPHIIRLSHQPVGLRIHITVVPVTLAEKEYSVKSQTKNFLVSSKFRKTSEFSPTMPKIGKIIHFSQRQCKSYGKPSLPATRSGISMELWQIPGYVSFFSFFPWRSHS